MLQRHICKSYILMSNSQTSPLICSYYTGFVLNWVSSSKPALPFLKYYIWIRQAVLVTPGSHIFHSSGASDWIKSNWDDEERPVYQLNLCSSLFSLCVVLSVFVSTVIDWCISKCCNLKLPGHLIARMIVFLFVFCSMQKSQVLIS